MLGCYVNEGSIMTVEMTRDVPNSDELSLRELVLVLWGKKLFILGSVILSAIVAVVYVKSLPNIYRSDALLSPVVAKSGLNVSGQLGGLAALAGVDIGKGAGSSNVDLALQIIKSRAFVKKFIEQHSLSVPLMASVDWDKNSNELIIDNEIYHEINKEWSEKPPTEQEMYKAFVSLLLIKTDKVDGVITISFDHYSPGFAQQVVSSLIKDINDEMRNRDINDAQLSVSFLNDKLNETTVSDLRTMLFSLIQEQTKTIMLASVKKEYTLSVIDPAVVPELKVAPKRAIIVLAIILLVFMISCFYVLTKHFVSKSSK